MVTKRKIIDWTNTCKNLKLLRCDNLDLRRFICHATKTTSTSSNYCDGVNCSTCKYDMDNSISQSELAKVFNVSESMVANWENGRSTPSLEDLLFYADISNLDLFDVLVFEE